MHVHNTCALLAQSAASHSEGWVVDTAVMMQVWVVCGLASVFVWGRTEGGVLEHREERILHGRPLSDKHRDGEEEADYDHDAFLGDEDAEYFETLDPEESQR